METLKRRHSLIEAAIVLLPLHRVCKVLFVALFLLFTSVCITGAQSRTALSNATALYPRVIRLAHNADPSKNGLIIASVTAFSGGSGEEDIYSSRDGQTFTQLGAIHDSDFASGLCCGTLFELPTQVGALAPGTLLWSGSVGQSSTTQPMQLKTYKSEDGGATWSYLSNCATAKTPKNVGGGLWEPAFEIASDGALVCFYSDETQTGHSQLLQQVRSYDGITWQDATFTVASTVPNDRPGMAVVTKLPSGTYFMTYELCGPAACTVFSRTSTDGWNWGTSTNMGNRIQTASGQWLEHAPTNVWSPSATSVNGTILLVGQMMYDASGSLSSGNGVTIFTNHSADGSGTWSTMSAPVQVPTAFNNYCPNYSSSLLPSVDGSSVLEFASDYVGSTCTMFFNSGPILAGTASPIVTVTPSLTRVMTFPLQVKVSVTGQPSVPAPTGNITLVAGTYSASLTLTNGSALFSIPGPLPAGADTLSASYAGDSNYTSATGSITVDVVAPPVVTVTPAVASITVFEVLNVGISVAPQGTGPTPTGSVFLGSGTYSSGAVALSAGSASVAVPGNSLAIGTDQLEATYSGDANYATQIGTAKVDVAPVPGFTIATTPVTIAAGAITGNSSTVTLKSFGAFSGSVALSASIVQFNGANSVPPNPPSFTFTPPGPDALAADSTFTATLQVSTTGSSTATKTLPSRTSFPTPYSGTALGSLFFFSLGHRKKKRSRITAALLLCIFAIAVTGCGGGSTHAQTAPATPPGSYLVKITGTAASITAETTLTVTVQ